MIFKNYVILIITLLLILPYKIMANEIYLPSAGFDCSDDKYKFEFLFDRSKDMDNPKVYRRVKGKFIDGTPFEKFDINAKVNLLILET